MSILNGFNNSIDYVLGQQECEFKERQTSGSAFCQQRYKIEPELFGEINEMILQYAAIANKQKRFKGHRIIAGDGTNLLLPHSKELKENFPCLNDNSKLGRKNPMCNNYTFYDTLNEVILSSTNKSRRVSEPQQVFENIEKINKPGDVFVFDRSMGYHRYLANLDDKGILFCCRIRLSLGQFNKECVKNDSTDFIADWYPAKIRKSEKKVTFKIESDRTFKVRVVKGKACGKTGEPTSKD